ncbi:SEP domain-containing protein [Lipomyces arxii]|uniref:SEP domain-containing protein n=1 Tax=Lipomyces arxii TaxID=56418 RepID=UPI0034CE2A3D
MSQDKSKRPTGSSNRVRTLADMNNDTSAGPSFGSQSPPSDDDGSNFGRAFRRGQPEDLFTGGEKSGLAVQKPDSERGRLVRDILRQAELGGQAEPPQAEPARPSTFRGSGHTLGGSSIPSEVTPPIAASPREETLAPVTRTLTFWRDGFSIEEGTLMRYDVPANQEILRAINSGRAPLHLLNVNPGQPVDVRVERRMDEDYVPPNPAKGGFYGEGHRLGA